MNTLNLKDLSTYAEQSIIKLHQARLLNIQKLVLNNELRNKDFNFYRTIQLHTLGELINRCVEHHIYLTEKRMFESWVKGLIIFICHQTHGGFKSNLPGVDFEFIDEDYGFLAKLFFHNYSSSLPQKRKWLKQLIIVKKKLQNENPTIVYKAAQVFPLAEDYSNSDEEFIIYSGTNFWQWLTGEDNFFERSIKPIVGSARSKDQKYWDTHTQMLNRFYRTFTEQYLRSDFSIDWEKLVRFNSGRDVVALV